MNQPALSENLLGAAAHHFVDGVQGNRRYHDAANGDENTAAPDAVENSDASSSRVLDPANFRHEEFWNAIGIRHRWLVFERVHCSYPLASLVWGHTNTTPNKFLEDFRGRDENKFRAASCAALKQSRVQSFQSADPLSPYPYNFSSTARTPAITAISTMKITKTASTGAFL